MQYLEALWSCKLIKDRLVTPESLAQFEDTLNAAQPARHTACALVSDLVADLMNDPENLYSVILNAPRGSQYIILYTNALYITRYFKLMYTVHLRQSRDGKYHASPYRAKASSSPGKFDAQAWQSAPRRNKPLSKHAREFIPLKTASRVFVQDEAVF